jgi:hypothetical protein
VNEQAVKGTAMYLHGGARAHRCRPQRERHVRCGSRGCRRGRRTPLHGCVEPCAKRARSRFSRDGRAAPAPTPAAATRTWALSLGPIAAIARVVKAQRPRRGG